MSPKVKGVIRRIALTKGNRLRSQKVWQAMRILRRFTIEELLAVTELGDEKRYSTRTFIGTLQRSGFVRKHATVRGQSTVFQLVRDSGPLPPAIVNNRTAVWDQNTNKEYPLNEQS